MFSKIDNTWQVSSLHKWWQEYNKLYEELGFSNAAKRDVAIQNWINELNESAPECNHAP